MNKHRFLNTFIVCLYLLTNASMQVVAKQHISMVKSPDGQLCLSAGVNIDGHPFYFISRGNEKIINPSVLGFKLKDGTLYKDIKINSIKRNHKDEIWLQPWGEDSEIRNNYNELVLCLQERQGLKRNFEIVFRVFDDGIGFRYVFPQQTNLKSFVIMDELTEFALPLDTKTWSIPANANYYEAIFKSSLASKKDTMSTPVTIEVNDSLYIAIHEANLTDYAAMNLAAKHNNGSAVSFVTTLTPWHSGEKVFACTPSVSPWRTITITKKPGELITSHIMINLNEPSKIKDTSWIKPGKYIGIWWGIHMKKNTWEQGPDHGATTTNMCKYIDFAAKHGFSSVLAEGWNHGWGDKRIDSLSFIKPYSDYDIKALCSYAKSKGVSIIAHNETWGNTKYYESVLDSAFSFYHSLGINEVKTGYVNPIMDNLELQHSQYGVRHYRKIIETAAKYEIMIDNHESIMPTGLQRTYPNLMTQEAVRGQEYNAWSPDGGNPPEHTCTLPFTRCLAGPLDYTPVIFNFHNSAMPGTHPQSTLARQLAEFIILYSPLQMAADMIENYEGQPAFSFIESCPTSWCKTIVPNGEIGKYITIARKDRNNNNWFMGSITDSHCRDMYIPLEFLDKGERYRAIIYEDGPDADYISNPYPMTIRQIYVNSESSIHLHLANGGGAAIRFEANK